MRFATLHSLKELTFASFPKEGSLYAGVVAAALSTLHPNHVEHGLTALTTVLTQHFSIRRIALVPDYVFTRIKRRRNPDSYN